MRVIVEKMTEFDKLSKKYMLKLTKPVKIY
jgi:hypothetical protein